jgi:DNA-directed RNA polymerase subunit RPC12/RpoP
MSSEAGNLTTPTDKSEGKELAADKIPYEYKCADCAKPVYLKQSDLSLMCPFCGGRVFLKPRTVVTTYSCR